MVHQREWQPHGEVERRFPGRSFITSPKEGKIVAFTGRLEASVPDILQLLSRSQKTGKLTLSGLRGHGEVLFKAGKIIHAAVNGAPNTLGHILVSRNLLSQEDLMIALELQNLSPQWKRLGAILIEQGFITHAVLGEAIRDQIKDAIFEFLTWETGYFRFEMLEIAPEDDVMVDPKDVLNDRGIAPEHILLEGLRWFDEQQKTEESPLRPAGVRRRYNFLPRPQVPS